MKKILILISVLLLAGCSNSVTLDFNDKIDADINLSFSVSDYKKHSKSDMSNAELKNAIDAIISEARPLSNSYDEMFKENKSNIYGENYSLEYSYTYTYDNISDSSIFKRCFDYSTVEEDDDAIYVYLKGKSECAPFDLKIKANNRMMRNNAMEKSNGEFTWTIKEDNNDIYFAISKERIKSNLFSFGNIIYFLLAIASCYGIYILSKRAKNN